MAKIGKHKLRPEKSKNLKASITQISRKKVGKNQEKLEIFATMAFKVIQFETHHSQILGNPAHTLHQQIQTDQQVKSRIGALV